MNKATFSKTLSGLRELELDVANLAEEGQIQIQGDFPTTEQVLIADPTINATIYKTLTPSMIGLENLTAGTNITYSAGTTYNGTAPITINATDTNTQLTLVEQNGIVITDLGGLNRGIATDIDANTIVFNGTEMEVAKVPNVLTKGTNINFSNTDDGAIETTYDGSTPITISSTDTNTEYTAGTNLNLAGTTFNLDTTITAMVGVEFLDNGSATNLTGSNYPGKPTQATYLDLSSTTNIILPPNCFFTGSEYRLAFNQGIFMPNDDQSYFNIAVEDDFSTNTHGRVKPLTSSLELIGFITIPNGWRATGGLVSLVNSSGSNVSRTTQYYNVRTYGGVGFITLMSGSTNSVTTFTTTMTGAVDRTLMLKVYTASTADFVGGGYIVIDKV